LSFATPGEIAAPAISAESRVYRSLPLQVDHQAERLLDRLLLGRLARGLLGFRHQRIIDLDIGAHELSSVIMCIARRYHTHRIAGSLPDRNQGGDVEFVARCSNMTRKHAQNGGARRVFPPGPLIASVGL
jgi:hypothetical protein